MSDKAIRNAQSTTANYIVCEKHGASGLTQISTSIIGGGVLPYILNEGYTSKAAISLDNLFVTYVGLTMVQYQLQIPKH